MKIAIVGPSPVPFTVGGVENLLWALCTWMNQNTPHQVELIKLPSRENSFWDLIDTYESFYKLDLDYFDMVITTKYPAWMVRHRNHVCYLLHRLRGLYDTYHFTGMDEGTDRNCAEINRVLDYMRANPDVEDLTPFFDMLRALRTRRSIPKTYFDFPGPFIRDIVHFLDNNALTTKRIRRFVSLSETVKKRTEYFPPDCDPVVAYCPSNLKHFSCGEYKHFFFVSRLDGPKRVDLLIEAMRYVRSDIPLYIAGTGPKEKELKEMAAGDERIHFLGFVNDEEVERYYRDSLVVPYFPYDEDYGLITIEAMMHHKPVITTMDAGGPTEFVTNDETGYVVPTDAHAIAQKLDYFAAHPEEARRMGDNACDLVSRITWDKLVDTLLREEDKGARSGPAVISGKSIVVTSSFPVYPPTGGGQARIFNEYRHIAGRYPVEIVSCTEKTPAFRDPISANLYETRVCKTENFIRENAIMESAIGTPASDVGIMLLHKLIPEYREVFRKSAENAAVMVLSHPYLWPAVKDFSKGKLLVYEAHNVEYLLKQAAFSQSREAKNALKTLFAVEKECCERADFIVTCSQEDTEKLAELYGVSREKMIVVPNGVDTSATVFTDVDERLNNKKQLWLANEKIGIFMGSWHGPNLEAAEMVLRMAALCPEVTFLLMGSQCDCFKKRQLPENVALLGLVSEMEKSRVFQSVDFALNPMLSGSGTNLKMFDYMAAGIPVFSTRFGTRGIDEKEHFLLAETEEEFASLIRAFTLDSDETRARVAGARRYVENTFDWAVVSRTFADEIEKRLR